MTFLIWSTASLFPLKEPFLLRPIHPRGKLSNPLSKEPEYSKVPRAFSSSENRCFHCTIDIDFPEFESLGWIDTETVDLELAKEWKDPEINKDVLAYLQYTSGSTSTPKGVMADHDARENNVGGEVLCRIF